MCYCKLVKREWLLLFYSVFVYGISPGRGLADRVQGGDDGGRSQARKQEEPGLIRRREKPGRQQEGLGAGGAR